MLASRGRRQALALLLVGVACRQPVRPNEESERSADAGAGATAAPAGSPVTEVTVLDPGREPRVVLALKPSPGGEEEVEVVHRMKGGEGVAARGERRILINVRADRVEDGRVEGELLIGPLSSGLPPCAEPSAGQTSGWEPGTLVGPVGVTRAVGLAFGPDCAPPPVTGSVRLSVGGLVEEVKLAPARPEARLLSMSAPMLGLVLPLPLPAVPVGAGARWRARQRAVEAGIETTTVTVCELVSFDGARGVVKAHVESTSPGGRIDDPALGEATLRDLRLRADREAHLDLSRLAWSSSSSMTVEAAVESEGAPVRARYELDASIAPPGGDYLGLLRRGPAPGVAPARPATALCRTLRGERSGDVSIPYPGGGKRVTGACRAGAPEGRWTWWHPDGSPELEAAFARGVPDGVWRQKTSSGRPLGEYRFAAGSGRAVLWEADGTRRATATFRGGVPHGDYAVWSAAGKRAAEGQLRDGRVDGSWTTWDDAGRIVRREVRDSRCLVIGDVLGSGPAARAGIQPGDQIDALNRSPVASGDALREALQAAKGRLVTLGIRRVGRPRSVRVTPAVDDAGQVRIGISLGCCHVLVPEGEGCGWE